MDITLVLEELLQNCDCTEQKIKYLSNMIRVRDNLREYPHLQNITIGDLEYIHLFDVRRIAKCYDILNTHAFTKHALIDMIRTKYNELTVFHDN